MLVIAIVLCHRVFFSVFIFVNNLICLTEIQNMPAKQSLSKSRRRFFKSNVVNLYYTNFTLEILWRLQRGFGPIWQLNSSSHNYLIPELPTLCHMISDFDCSIIKVHLCLFPNTWAVHKRN